MASVIRALPFIALLALVAAASAKIKGMAFSTGHDTAGYRQPYTDKSLDDLRATGANYVHISAYSKMDNVNALYANDVTDPQSVRYIIRKAKAKGMNVFFKPVIEVENNIWRGFIPGRPIWFSNVYIPFIARWARIARDENVDLFALGSEYVATLNQTAEWKKVNRRVRAIYKGNVTYVGNHDAYKKVGFWNLMDIVSISGYFKLLPGESGPSPNSAKTRRLWKGRADELIKWKLRNKITPPILIAEVGAQSKGNGVVYRIPWDWLARAPKDNYEQVKMYHGILSAFMWRPWCMGVVFWNWELDPEAGKSSPGDTGYTPQNKPALRVMTTWFKRFD